MDVNDRQGSEAYVILEAFAPVMAAGSFATGLREAARQLSALAGASVPLGLLAVLHGDVLDEAWHPEESAQSSALRTHLRRLGIASAAQGCAVVESFPPTVGDELEPALLLLPLHDRFTGVLCWARPRAASDDREVHLMMRAVQLMAQRLVALQELEAERRRSEQYERWFQVSVRQIHTLDRERQKFAALANSANAAVFVADRTGTVRWCSRALLEHFPGPGPQHSWVTEPCQALCQQIGGGRLPACSRCLVAEAADCDLAERPILSSTDEQGHWVEITARPIRDVTGKTEEVIVVLRSDAVAGHDVRRLAAN
jgi:PAS domain-containing protein